MPSPANMEITVIPSTGRSASVDTAPSAGTHIPFATNTAILIASQLSRYGLTAATLAIVARVLGPKALGEVQLAYLLPAWVLLLTSLGLPVANIYFLGKRVYPLPMMLGNVLLRWIIETCLVVPVLILARQIVLHFVPVSPELYLAIVFWIPLQIVNSYLASLLTAQMRFLEQFWVSVLQGGAIVIAVLIALVPLRLGTLGTVGGLAAATGIAVLLQLWILRKDFSLQHLMPHPMLFRDCLRFGIRGYFANLAQFVTYRLDSFIVSYFMGAAALGIYTAAYTAAELLCYLPSSLATVVFPATAGSSMEDANWRTARLSRLTFAFVLVAAIIAASSAPLVFRTVVGPRFSYSAKLFWILLPGIVLLAASKVITADLLGRGLPQYASRGSVGGMVTIALLDILLIPKYGLIAAAASSSVVYGGQAVYWIRCLTQVTGMKASELLVVTRDDVRLALNVFLVRTRPLGASIRSLFVFSRSAAIL